MSTYEKVLKSLYETKTLHSHIVAIGKIRVSTEDKDLKLHLNDAIEFMGDWQYRRTGMRSIPVFFDERDLDATNKHKVDILIEYCKQKTEAKKPEWQVLAERHGWSLKT